MISVIIPLYNKENSIERSVHSVLKQSYLNYELIIVDDGSTDSSLSVVKSIISRSTHNKVKIVEQENGGPSKARNTGIISASGDWIVTLDADDELVEDALQLMAEEVLRHPEVDIIDFGGYIQEDGVLKKRKHPLQGWVSNPLRSLYFRQISPSCGHAIIKASLLKRHLYDERIRRFEDYDIELRMLAEARVFCSDNFTEIHHVDYCEASHARKDVKEDFLGYLDFTKGGFWYKMCLFRIFVEERGYYKESCKDLYPIMYYRYDLLLLHKLLLFVERFCLN